MKKHPIMELEFFISGGEVLRFHTIDTIKHETIAHHSYNVAMLCNMLSADPPRSQLIMAALFHDLAEQKYGDIPAPTKKTLTEMGMDINAAEAAYLAEFGFIEELDLCEKLILKLADALAGMLFCIRERRLGNRNMDRCYGNYYAYVIEAVTSRELRGIRAGIFEHVDNLWRIANEFK